MICWRPNAAPTLTVNYSTFDDVCVFGELPQFSRVVFALLLFGRLDARAEYFSGR